MTPPYPATILVLEDEPEQRETLKIILAKFGTVIAKGHPKEALEFLKTNHVDAAIVDIRMPHLEVDGLWFLKEAREHDPFLGLVLRTGDSDVSIAQAGIEARAVHRIVKGGDSARDLNSSVETAIRETRERRALSESGSIADQAKSKLFQAIGKTDRGKTAVNLCLGFTRDLAPQISAVGGFTARLAELCEKSNDKEMKDVVAKLAATSDSLRKIYTHFVANPFFETSGGKRSPTCNAACESLSQSFKNDADFAGLNILTIHGQTIDAIIGSDPVSTLTVLRYLVDFTRAKLQSGGSIFVSWVQCDSPRDFIEKRRCVIRLTEGAIPAFACSIFTISAKIGAPEPHILQAATQEIPETSRGGKLGLATHLANAERLLLSASTQGLVTEFHLFVPQR